MKAFFSRLQNFILREINIHIGFFCLTIHSYWFKMSIFYTVENKEGIFQSFIKLRLRNKMMQHAKHHIFENNIAPVISLLFSFERFSLPIKRKCYYVVPSMYYLIWYTLSGSRKELCITNHACEFVQLVQSLGLMFRFTYWRVSSYPQQLLSVRVFRLTS